MLNTSNLSVEPDQAQEVPVSGWHAPDEMAATTASLPTPIRPVGTDT